MAVARQFSSKLQQPLITISITVGFLALLAGLYIARWAVLATAIGIGFGVIISPLVEGLRRRLKIPRAVSVILLLIGFLSLSAATIYAVISLISHQFVPLFSQMPHMLASAREWVEGLLERYPAAAKYLSEIRIADQLKGTAGTIFQGITTGATAFAGLAFVLTVALYLAVNASSYLAGLLSMFPAYLRPRARAVLLETAGSLRQWFVSQLLAMAAVGSLTALGLWIVGMDYWPAIGVLTAVLDIIPYVGPVISATVAVIVTLGTDPSKLLLVMAVYIAMQQVEGNIIIPLIMKGRINLPPIHLMTLMLLLGTWFGVVGVFIAPATLTVARTIYLMTYVEKMNRMIESPQTSDDRKAA